MSGKAIVELEEFFPYRLSVLANTISKSLARIYSERFGLTIPEWRVMAVLASYPGLCAAEVADYTAQDKMAVSRAVARLLKAGRLLQKRAKEDRRRSSLTLSADGWRIYRQVAPLALTMERRLLKALTREQLSLLDECVQVLQKRAEHIAP